METYAEIIAIVILILCICYGCQTAPEPVEPVGTLPSATVGQSMGQIEKLNLDTAKVAGEQAGTLGKLGDATATQPALTPLVKEATEDNRVIRENMAMQKQAIQQAKPAIQKVEKNETALIATKEENRKLKEAPLKEWIDMLMWTGFALLGVAGVLLALQSFVKEASFGLPITILGMLGGLALGLGITLAWFAEAIAIIGLGLIVTALVGVLGYAVWRVIGLIRSHSAASVAVSENVDLMSKFRAEVAKLGPDGDALVEKWFKNPTPLAHAVQSDSTIQIVRDELGKV
jgi:hypothetical protein